MLGAVSAIIGGCASIAASCLVAQAQKGMQYDSARAQAYSRLLARTHEVLTADQASEAMSRYLEAYYESCVLASRGVAEAAAVLHEVVRVSVLGERCPVEVETLAIEDFVAAVKEELGVVEGVESGRAVGWPSAYRVLRLPRRKASARPPER